MEKKLYRSRKDRMVLGVCGGIAEYFSVDSTLVRIIFLLFFLTGSWAVIFYLILGLVVPENPSQKPVKHKHVSEQNYLLVGAGLIIFGSMLLLRNYGLMDWGNMWPIMIIIVGGYLVWQNTKK